VGDRLYFTADDGVHGRELWTSDGTVLGTHLVVDISDHPSPGSWVSDLTAFGDRLAFMAHGDTPDRVLWVSDGTSAGTRSVSEVSPHSELSSLTAMGDYVYFNASDDAHDPTGGYELWRSDGTLQGTTRVADINPVPAPPNTYPVGSLPSLLTVVGDTLFFTAYEPTHGRSLWSTDGTAEGTALVEDVEDDVPTFDPGRVDELTAVGDDLYLAVTDTVHGAELWSTAAPTAALPRATDEARPTVVGAASYGGTVTVDPGSWSPPTASFSYRWVGTGIQPDPTSRSITLDENTVGSDVSVLVTASSPGYRTRSAYAVPVLVTGAVRFPDPPQVVGTARVGAVLRAEGVSSVPVTASLFYDWFVRGSREPIGSGPTLRVPAGAVGRPIVVRVTGLATGWDTASRGSSSTPPVSPATFTLTTRPALTGRPRVGSRLTVSTGSVAPAAGRTTVQWLRNGRALASATGLTYRLRAADRAARISVRITWTRRGYEPLSRTLRRDGAVRRHG
jgi:ELWxxDGT repeat protein